MVRSIFFVCLGSFLVISTSADANPRDSLAILSAIEGIYPMAPQNKDSILGVLHQLEEEAQESEYRYGIALARLKISRVHWVKTEYDESTRYGLEAFTLFEALGDVEMQARALTHLGRTYADMKLLPKAHEFLQKALRLASSVASESFHSELNRNMARLHQLEQRFDSIIYYADIARAIDEKLGDESALGLSYSYLAAGYRGKKETASWLKSELKSLEYTRKANNFRGASISAGRLADYYLEVRNFDKAVNYAEEAIHLSKRSGFLRARQAAYEVLDSVHVLKQDFRTAYRYGKRASLLRDSIYSTEKAQVMADLQANFEIQQRDKEIGFLEKDKLLQEEKGRLQRLYLIFSLTVVVLLTGGIIALFSRSKIKGRYTRNLEEKNREIEKQRVELQKQASELKELNEVKNRLFSIVSHDLRNAIGGLKAALDMLNDHSLSREEFNEVSGLLKQSTDTTYQMTENLLQWSLGQMGGMSTKPEIFNMADLIRESKNLLQSISSQKNIMILTDAEHQVLVKADPKQIDLVLRNLIGNAVKFTPAGGKVEVGVKKDTELYAKVFVKDNGIGMGKEDMEKLLISTSYHSTPGTGKEKGTGLGLRLCREFVEKNGSSLQVESEPGKGTIFWFELPVAS